MVTQAPCGEPTPAELSLVDHVRRGERLDLAADGEVIDEAAMRSWGDSRTCRASVIREILRGRLAAGPDPHGLRLRGARISGRLDLENLTTDVHFELTDCLLEEGVLARNAHMAFVGLTGCRLKHPGEPPMDAARLACSMLDLSRTTIIGHAKRGAVRLPGARIGGQLNCTGATLRNDFGPALYAESLQVGQGMFLRNGFTATGAGEAGAVRLTGAHISGNLECDGADLRNKSGPALSADRLQVEQSMFLRNRFTATGASEIGAVRLLGAHISGNLECDGADLRNESGPALSADRLQVEQGMFLRNRFTATGASEIGAVRLLGAHISGDLECDGADLRNEFGPALSADGLQVEQGMFLRNGFTATGAGEMGAVRLLGAHIGGNLVCNGARLVNNSGPALIADSLQVGQDMYLRGEFTAIGSDKVGAVRLLGAHIGQLECDGARLVNNSGPALYADGLQVSQDMYLRGKFTAIGSGEDGAVRLLGAYVGGEIDCSGARLRNNSGPALIADSLQVSQDIFLRGWFTAFGSGKVGAVRLRSAHIGGQLDCSGATLGNDSGPALAADGLQVGQDMFLRNGFAAIGGGTDVAVDLTGTGVDGALLFDLDGLKHATDSDRRLALDGLTYGGVPELVSAEDWLELLRHGTRSYAAQPYQQLAAGYRALGDDRRARQILMAQRDDQLDRADTHWSERLWGRITKVTLGYGYKPWRALWFLFGVVVVSFVLAVVLGAHGALAQTDKTATPGRSCTVVQQVSVGLDLNLPVGTSVARADCDLTRDSASVAAASLAVAGWVLRPLAWAFAALFIAGFTSAVRKT